MIAKERNEKHIHISIELCERERDQVRCLRVWIYEWKR